MTKDVTIPCKSSSWFTQAWYCLSALRDWWQRDYYNMNGSFRIVLRKETHD